LGRLTTDTFEDLCCTLRSRHAERAQAEQHRRDPADTLDVAG